MCVLYPQHLLILPQLPSLTAAANGVARRTSRDAVALDLRKKLGSCPRGTEATLRSTEGPVIGLEASLEASKRMNGAAARMPNCWKITPAA